nr:zinc finger, CCHC-type [Tanacetum cinerariifolium]
MTSMNTSLNIKKLDGNIVQKHGGKRRWKIKTGNVFDSCNQRSTQQYKKSRIAKHLGVAGIQQQNGLVDETNVTFFAKVRASKGVKGLLLAYTIRFTIEGFLKEYTSKGFLVGRSFGGEVLEVSGFSKHQRCKKLYTFHMHPGKSQSEYIDEFHKLVGDLAAINTDISYEDQMTEAKGDGGEGLYVRRRSGQRDMEQGTYSAWSKLQGRSSRLRCYICQSGEHLKRDCPRECRVRGRCKVQVHMRDESSFVLDNVRYVSESRRNLISLGTLEKEGFSIKMQSGKIKVIKGSLVVLSGTRRANCVYTLDGQAVTRKTLKGRKQLGEYQSGWKIKTGNVLDFCKQRSIQQCTKSEVAKHSGVVGLQQQNGLVDETKVTLLAKVRVQCRCCKELIEVEPQEDHTFEVEPHGNFDNVASSQEVQTQDLIYYHLERDREQHSTCELFNYKENSNETAFVVAEAEKIYAHESLTFNNIVACEVISKWKAGLKDDMDARSDVYVLSNGCKKCSDDSDAIKDLLDKAKENVLGMEIVKDQSGTTLRVSQSKFYNGKLVQTLLEGHFILSLEGSLSGDCDVEKNGYTYGGCKRGYWAKGTRNRVTIRAKDNSGYCYRFLVKGYPWSEVPA